MPKAAARYCQHPAVTPETEISALVGIYRRAIEAADQKEAAGPRQASDPLDGTESKGDSANGPKSKA